MASKLAAGQVTDLDPYKFMAVIGKRVIHPGGRASTQALLRRAQITGSARVLDVGCGVATSAIEIARRGQRPGGGVGGLVTVTSGDILGLTPRGFLADEGLPRCLAIMGQVVGRPASARKMAWLMPGMAMAVP